MPRGPRSSRLRVFCTWQDCTLSFAKNFQLDKHISFIHKWEPKGCLVSDCDQCGQPILFSTYYAYNYHMRKHTGRYPTRCFFPECDELKMLDRMFNCFSSINYSSMITTLLKAKHGTWSRASKETARVYSHFRKDNESRLNSTKRCSSLSIINSC